jgi:hypothetical protein
MVDFYEKLVMMMVANLNFLKITYDRKIFLLKIKFVYLKCSIKVKKMNQLN